MWVDEVRKKGMKEEGPKWKEGSGVIGSAEEKHGYGMGKRRKKKKEKGEKKRRKKKKKGALFHPNFSKEKTKSSRRK